MNITRYLHFNLLIHALAWSIVLLLPYLVSDAENNYRIGVLPGQYFTLSVIVHMAMFYLNCLLFYPRLVNRSYWPLYVLSVAFLIYSSYLLKLFILTRWFPNAVQDVKTHVLFPSVMAFVASMIYCITADKIRSEKTHKEMQALQLEVELKFLRSQISPHFLFNILTNLVSLARQRSDQMETSLLRLSSLMRYMLNESGKKIPLPREIEYLKNYVALQQLRFGDEVSTTFTIDGPFNETGYSIEPMLLIPFIENAYKHGVGYVKHPIIEIRISVCENILLFEVKNKFGTIHDMSKDESSGIGLNNVRSRLDLLYPQGHQLLINNENNFFTINLSLDLEE